MAVPNGLNPNFENVTAKKPIISATVEGATRTLHPSESGSLIVLDRAAGCVVTLPTSAPKGAYYDFVVGTTPTTGYYKIAAGSGDVIIGQVIEHDTDVADGDNDSMSFYAGNNTTAVAILMDGSVYGGVLGTGLRLLCLSSTAWFVSGVNKGIGSVATPFTTS